MNTQEFCHKIGSLRQVCLNSNHQHNNTPEEIFEKSMQLSVSLPDDAMTWSIQL